MILKLNVKVYAVEGCNLAAKVSHVLDVRVTHKTILYNRSVMQHWTGPIRGHSNTQ